MDLERNRAVIIPSSQQGSGGGGVTITNKPLASATRFDWVKATSQDTPSSESRSCQIRRTSLSQRLLSNQTKLCYRLADLVMVMCLIFPLVIAFWRGVWQLMEFYSKLWNIDPWFSMAVGYSIPFLLHLFQEPLKQTVCIEKMSFPAFYILSRSVLLVHSFGSVNQWRGLWTWMDIEYGMESVSSLVILLIGMVFSVGLKTLNNILAPPLFCLVDDSKSIHDCPLRFKTSPRTPLKYFLDVIFSVIVIPAFVVCCWRGLWTLADLHLFPHDEIDSAMASLCLGYAICVMLCLAQPSICHRVRNLKGLARIAFMDIVCFFGFVGCVLAWRGVWNSYNIFFVFETQNLSEWITTIIGAVGTMILGCISAVVVRGIAIDGDMVEDGGAEWLIPYISVINTPVYDVPFPEPWVCRYFCTSQKISWRKRRQGVKDSTFDATSVDMDCDKPLTNPLKIVNALGNSKSQPNPNRGQQPKFRLSELPNIDSSSEEELGMRGKMTVQQDENRGNNNETDEVQQEQTHQT